MKQVAVTRQTTWGRIGIIPLAISSVLLALFPLVRPFGDRSGIPSEAVQTFTSTSWVVAHVMGAVGFILFPIGLFGLHSYFGDGPARSYSRRGLILCMAGVGLFLPIFGTEAFALRAIGQEAVLENNPGLVSVANSIRTGPQIVFLIASLVLLGVAGIMTGVAVWKSGCLSKVSGVSLALGLALFFPLFPQVIRAVDGLLIAVGGVWLVLTVLRRKGPVR